MPQSGQTTWAKQAGSPPESGAGGGAPDASSQTSVGLVLGGVILLGVAGLGLVYLIGRRRTPES